MSASNHGESITPEVFNENMAAHERTGVNAKSVRKMSEATPRKAAIGKGDARYWMQPGKLIADARCRGALACKVQVAGRRESFPLRTTNKSAAATKAARIYGDVVALGWEEALAKHKPDYRKPEKAATIGAWAEEVKATAGLRTSTLTTYLQSLRQIAAEIREIGDQPALDESGTPKRDREGHVILRSRFDYRSGGREAWASKVDALPLSVLDADSVQRWKLRYIEKAGSAPDARRRAENSAATLLRCARSLFSPKARKFAEKKLTLPSPRPFADVEMPKRGSTAYQSRIDATELIQTARRELKGEPFKIFVLGLLCGLRKREIDLLTWKQVDFEKGVVRIERTEFFTPKSEDSVGTVDVDSEVLALLKHWKEHATGAFVIESTRQPRHHHSRVNYRCEPHFASLYSWLRTKEVAVRKPLHELRKELGAILASEQGIYAAKSVLRHAQISTTAAYYTDKKKRITAGLGIQLTQPLT